MKQKGGTIKVSPYSFIMLSPEDFELPAEREFTLVKIRKEIDQCTNLDELRENLKKMAEQNAKFQHMIGKLLQVELNRELDKLFPPEGKK